MRDDRHVRRFRMHPFWIKCFIWFLALLILAAGGGLFAGYHFWQENQELTRARKMLERRLIEAEVRMERLENVEKILQSNDPDDLQALLGSVESDQSPDTPPMDLSEIFSQVDSHQAGVENIQAKFTGRGMRVRFDLNYMQTDKSQKWLSGEVEFALVTNTGRLERAEAQDPSDLSFSIQKFKQIRATLTLPEGLEQSDVFGLRLVIRTPEGKAIFSDTYPLYRVLS
jgi:hypothetical protein